MSDNGAVIEFCSFFANFWQVFFVGFWWLDFLDLGFVKVVLGFVFFEMMFIILGGKPIIY